VTKNDLELSFHSNTKVQILAHVSCLIAIVNLVPIYAVVPAISFKGHSRSLDMSPLN